MGAGRTNHNILGDIEAENDHPMLDVAFFETQDYKALFESSDRHVIVGRRGAGKSALAYKLSVALAKSEHTRIVSLNPLEDQVIALRVVLECFGGNVNLIRSASKILWKHALLMEIITHSAHYDKDSRFDEMLKVWQDDKVDITRKIRDSLNRFVKPGERPETLIGELAQNLLVSELYEHAKELLRAKKKQIVIMIDRLDEGFQPDTPGIGFLTGLLHATVELNKLDNVRIYAFVRDNIFRAITRTDPDFSKNIEGHHWRLHWDEYQLFNMVVSRIRFAFGIDLEKTQRVWERVTAREIQGQDGFKKCLRQTLYRPRDILSLLNQAFLEAKKHGRVEIIDEDVAVAGKFISEARLQDLYREYEDEFPGISHVTSSFANKTPQFAYNEAVTTVAEVLAKDSYNPRVQEDIQFIHSGEDAVRILYSIGFLGIKDRASGSFVFSHDGRSPDRDFVQTDEFVVHPCFWRALNLAESIGEHVKPEEIFDEYDVSVNSHGHERRKAEIGRLMTELGKIPLGPDHSADFENWCLRVLSIVFAGKLRNFEKKPNPGNAVQRRDIVASNLKESPLWTSLADSYDARQVIFECKNYFPLTSEDFRQLTTYMNPPYGRIGFFINRDDKPEPSSNEVDWIKEMYNGNPHKLIVKLTAKQLSDWLSKRRSADKYDHVEDRLAQLIDVYERNYLSLKGSRRRSIGKKRLTK